MGINAGCGDPVASRNWRQLMALRLLRPFAACRRRLAIICSLTAAQLEVTFRTFHNVVMGANIRYAD